MSDNVYHPTFFSLMLCSDKDLQKNILKVYNRNHNSTEEQGQGSNLRMQDWQATAYA